MLFVVFDSEPKAYEATEALYKLDKEGSIDIHAESVIKKDLSGKVELMSAKGDFPIHALGGTAIGSLIGLLGGPVGLLVGAAAGATLGSFHDLYLAGIDAGFIVEVSAKLTAGKFAVVADISEDWVTPLDLQMEKLGGSVFRTPKKDVETEQRVQDVERVKADIKQLKAELAKAPREGKARLQAKLDKQEENLKNKREQARKRLTEIKKEQDAKVETMEKKASKAKGDTKAAITARVSQIRKEYQQSKKKLENSIAERLEKRAKKLEKKAEQLKKKEE
jgi:uncharacterized membrane protein